MTLDTDTDEESGKDDYESDRLKKCRKLEIENDSLKKDVKKIKNCCKELAKKLDEAMTKVLNLAACGKQGKTNEEMSNLNVAKKGMWPLDLVKFYHLKGT